MNALSEIEKLKDIRLPEIYRNFFNHCFYSIPEKLVGTDLLNIYPDLNKFALELLNDDGIDIFLEKDDIVFMMHQGYMFWYFKANGNPDPIVYGYHESKLVPEDLGNFSNFIKDFT
jgi:hypothetical protein